MQKQGGVESARAQLPAVFLSTRLLKTRTGGSWERVAPCDVWEGSAPAAPGPATCPQCLLFPCPDPPCPSLSASPAAGVSVGQRRPFPLPSPHGRPSCLPRFLQRLWTRAAPVPAQLLRRQLDPVSRNPWPPRTLLDDGTDPGHLDACAPCQGMSSALTGSGVSMAPLGR